jgi:predicted GNAT family acetyltransferase
VTARWLNGPVALTFEHDEHAQRYILREDDETVAYADYRLADDEATAVFHHTLTLPQHRGRGLAAEVIRRALDDVRASGRKVVPTCWSVDDYLRDHPDVADLRA